MAHSPGFLSGFFLPLGLFAGILLPALTASARVAGSPSVQVAPTQTELSVSTIEGSSRTRATFTAAVKATETSATETGARPTGSVSFRSGEQSFGSALLDSEGRATYTAEALPAGLQKITAVYEGDDSHKTSNSTPAAVNSATSGVAAYTLSASSTALNVVAGGTATTVITATPENGFNQAVSLSCSGVPYVSVTCTFSPSTVTPGGVTSAAPNGTPVRSTLSIQTIAPSGELHQPGRRSETVYAVLLPGVLALAGLGLAGRKNLYGKYGTSARRIGLIVLLFAGALGLGGCAQRYRYFHKPPAGNPGTPAGTYTVIVSGITGQGSSLSTATVQFTLTVAAS